MHNFKYLLVFIALLFLLKSQFHHKEQRESIPGTRKEDRRHPSSQWRNGCRVHRTWLATWSVLLNALLRVNNQGGRGGASLSCIVGRWCDSSSFLPSACQVNPHDDEALHCFWGRWMVVWGVVVIFVVAVSSGILPMERRRAMSGKQPG